MIGNPPTERQNAINLRLACVDMATRSAATNKSTVELAKDYYDFIIDKKAGGQA